MSTKSAAPYQRLLASLHRADLLSRRVADRQLGEQIGIGRAMFLTLDLLDAADVKNQQEIADHLGLTKAAVSRHITTARNRGWLSSEPSSGSRRENTVALTSAGQDLVQRGRRYRSIAERRAAEELGAEDLLRTAKTLDRLSADLEQRLRAEA